MVVSSMKDSLMTIRYPHRVYRQREPDHRHPATPPGLPTSHDRGDFMG
jgi:hypothetical protein